MINGIARQLITGMKVPLFVAVVTVKRHIRPENNGGGIIRIPLHPKIHIKIPALAVGTVAFIFQGVSRTKDILREYIRMHFGIGRSVTHVTTYLEPGRELCTEIPPQIQ